MGLEDTESAESFYFLLRPSHSDVLPRFLFSPPFFFVISLADHFRGLEGQWVRSLSATSEQLGNPLICTSFHGIT